MHDGVASRLAPLLTKIMLGSDRGDGPSNGDGLPIRVRAWDGSTIGPDDAPTFIIRHRRALRRLLWKPGEMGLVRAYVAGELDIEGDIFAALGAVQRVLRSGDQPIRLASDDKREIVRTAVTLGAVGPEPKPPPEEFPIGRVGHSVAQAGRLEGERGAGTGPLEESAAFFARLLGTGLATGCGYWDLVSPDGALKGPPGGTGLAEAQQAAHEAITARLGLFPGARVLDLRCGWGALAFHIARRHSVRVVGLARSVEQAEYIRSRAVEEGLVDRVEPRVGDLASAGGGPYDAVVGLSGIEQRALPAPGEVIPQLFDMLAPGGRLIVQQMVRRPGPRQVRRTFTTSYVFPENGELRSLGEVVSELEEAGLEVRRVGALRENYARTMRAWAANLQGGWTECGELASPGRARVWLLYLAASALALESGRIGAHEICAIRRYRDGRAGETLLGLSVDHVPPAVPPADDIAGGRELGTLK